MVWRFSNRLLKSSSKYHLKQEGTVVELVIYKLQRADSGEYTCDTGSRTTSAFLTVQGRVLSFMHPLESSLLTCITSLHHIDILSLCNT